MNNKRFNLLCLGDSYTIGEGVPLYDSFPYQTIQILRKENYDFNAPEIIAKTAWTTFELMHQLSNTILLPEYDFVTLLIGVNNQYRNLALSEFETDFTNLLSKAVTLTHNTPKRVIVLSIPNWGVTTFAKDKNESIISKEIEDFNLVCKEITLKKGAQFIDITPLTLLAKNDMEYLADDGLHYSAKAMHKWSDKLAETIIRSI
jgi:lysophospholipase L1-like esterase